MNKGQAVKAIQRRWLDQWPTLAPTVKFSLDNIAKAEGAYFARLAVVTGSSQQWTMGKTGTRKFQRTGFIDVRLSGPISEGRGKLDDLAQLVTDIYESVRFGKKAGEHGVVTFATTPSELRKDKQAQQEWILSVVTPFEFYEVR